MNQWARIPKKQRVEVDWIDSGFSNRWERLSHVDDSIPHCTALGYCIKKTRDVIVMATCISDSGEAGPQTTIPRACVKAIRKVVVQE